MKTYKTKQEVFDKVVDHLLSQNSKSLSDDRQHAACMYRGFDGKMCAVGCLIPDELYNKSLENQLVGSETLTKVMKQVIECYDQNVACMLTALQMVHDGHPVECWKQELKNVANRLSLRWRYA